MENDFSAYIERIRPVGGVIGGRVGHRIASGLLSFAMGMYDRSAERCDQSIEALGEVETHRAVVTALRILGGQARSLVATQVSVRSEFTFDGAEEGGSVKEGDAGVPEEPAFSGDDRALLAIPEADEADAPPYVVARDNAFFLLYAVAITASADDTQALEEQVFPLLLARLDHYRAQS